MALNETISTGNKYRRLKDASTKLWQRLSFWTKASDVEFDNGATAEASLGNIQGITDSLNSNSSTVAASAAAVNTLNSNISVYVGSDGKIHFRNGSGADSALNFSSYQTGYNEGHSAGYNEGYTAGQAAAVKSGSLQAGLYLANEGAYATATIWVNGTIIKQVRYGPNGEYGKGGSWSNSTSFTL